MRVFTRKRPRGDRANCGGANLGYRGRIHHRQQFAGLAAEQKHAALMRVFADRRVVRKYADRL